MKHSNETKKKMSAWKRTDKIKRKISLSQIGKTLSQETKNKISKSKRGQCLGEKNGNSNKVYQYDYDTGNLISIYGSANQIFKQYGISLEAIRKSCRLIKNKKGELIAYKNCIWSYTPILNVEKYKFDNNVIKKYTHLGTTGKEIEWKK